MKLLLLGIVLVVTVATASFVVLWKNNTPVPQPKLTGAPYDGWSCLGPNGTPAWCKCTKWETLTVSNNLSRTCLSWTATLGNKLLKDLP